MKRIKLLFVLLVSIFHFSITIGGEKKNDQKEINLLFIITDQQRYDALGYAGNKEIKTPVLDQLAEDGAFFRNAYTQCAVCVPARASILTGKTNENSGVISNQFAEGEESSGIMSMKTFDEVLDENGYICEYYGKWHNPIYRGKIYKNELPVAGVYNNAYGRGMKEQYVDYLKDYIEKRPLKPGEYYDPLSGVPYKADQIDKHLINLEHGKTDEVKISQSDIYGVLDMPAEHTITALHGKQTIEAIGRLKDKSFSITCSFNPPHPPILSVEPYRSMYPPNNMVIPLSINDKMENSPYIRANRKSMYPEYTDPDKVKFMISNYYALVTEIDHWVGKILQKLTDEGLADNTLVIFTSDHGEMLGAHGMHGKFNFLEESSHIPLIMRLPKQIQKGKVVNSAVSNIDLYATILDYLNVKGPVSDGKSLRRFIEQGENELDEFVVSEWLQAKGKKPNYMIVKNKWKMLVPCTSESKVIDALYNLNDDPHELNNLIGGSDRNNYQDKVEELQADLLSWLKQTGSANYTGLKNRVILD